MLGTAQKRQRRPAVAQGGTKSGRACGLEGSRPSSISFLSGPSRTHHAAPGRPRHAPGLAYRAAGTRGRPTGPDRGQHTACARARPCFRRIGRNCGRADFARPPPPLPGGAVCGGGPAGWRGWPPAPGSLRTCPADPGPRRRRRGAAGAGPASSSGPPASTSRRAQSFSSGGGAAATVFFFFAVPTFSTG